MPPHLITYKLTLLFLRKHIFKYFHKTRLTSCSNFNKGESPPSGKFNSTSWPTYSDKVVFLKYFSYKRCWWGWKLCGTLWIFLWGWIYAGMSFVCFILFWNTYSVPLFWYCLENKGFPTFQNSKLTFVKLDKIYFLLSGNLFSDWQQIFCSTRNSREIKESAVDCRLLELCIKISGFKPRCGISTIEHRNM